MNRYELAADVLRCGGVLAYPTEAVFGLGCDPDNEAAVLRLLALKDRPVSKGLILIAAEVEQFHPYIEPETFAAHPEVLASWPGPHTWLLPCRPDTPYWLRGEHDTLAVRVTAHEPSVALCRAFGKAIVSTSANPGGAEPARDLETVQRYFPGLLDGLLDAPLGGADQVSSIRDARSGRRLR